MQRIRTGLRLAKASWNVLKADQSLVIFPIISIVASIVSVALVMAPWWLGLDAGSATGTEAGENASPLMWALMLVAGYVTTAIAIFFNVALASCAARSLEGEDTKVGEGIAAASARLPQILGWALIAFVVGLILRALDELADEAPFPLNVVANIGVALLGMAWGAVTFLVVPVLALEDVGPKEAFSRSKTMIIQKWGEGLTGNIGIGMAVSLLGVLPGVLICAVGVAVAANGIMAGGVFLIALGVLVVIAASIIGSTLNQVFAVTLYRYASGNELAAGFTVADMDQAFRKKQAKR